MSMPAPVPTIDVTEAERRLREDPDAPLLLDVRELGEFVEVRAPGAALVPTSTFMTRVDELPADRPLLVVCHVGRPVGGGRELPDPRRTHGRGQRGGRDGRLGEGRPAGPSRAARAGRRRPAAGLTPVLLAPGPVQDACEERLVCALWANATPTRISRMKLMAPTVAALR